MPLTDITKLLQPFPSDRMNAYPVSDSIKNPGADGKELIKPTGQRLVAEKDITRSDDVKLQGMGSNKRNREEGGFFGIDLN